MSVRTMGRAVAAFAAMILSLPFVVLSVPAASALDQPKLPQPVAAYFADGLVLRLIDLYGAGDGTTKGTDFDATTKVGTIVRLREFTPDFLAGKVSDDPTRLTNDWVAPVSVRGKVLGLATVWINPASDEPELASFASADFARQIALAPQGSWLVHDEARAAWFALTEDALIPLVTGTSGVTAATTPAAYQRMLVKAVAAPEVASSSGVTVAALVLGIVVLGVAIFVVLPVKRKSASGSPDDDDDDDDVDSDFQVAIDVIPPVKPPVTPSAKPKVMTDVKPKAKPDVKPKVKPDVKANVKPTLPNADAATPE